MKQLIQIKKKETIKQINDMVNLLGLVDVFGAESKAVEFCITFTRKQLNLLSLVIPTLDDEKMTILLSSIKKLREKQKAEKELQKLEKEVKSNTSKGYD